MKTKNQVIALAAIQIILSVCAVVLFGGMFILLGWMSGSSFVVSMVFTAVFVGLTLILSWVCVKEIVDSAKLILSKK